PARQERPRTTWRTMNEAWHQSSERHSDATPDNQALQPKSHEVGRNGLAPASVDAYLFVYGTLRPEAGHKMGQFLARRGRLLGPARAPGRLLDLGRFPGMSAARADNEWVHGVVYELDDPAATLALLDRHEGCAPESPQPWWFERALRRATLASGTEVT